MNTSSVRRWSQVLLPLAGCFLALSGWGQGTAFTYQGRLDDNNSPATGLYDFRFRIFNAAAGGTVIAGPLSTNGIPVTNGLFSIALDFGAGVFTGAGRWMECAVRTNGLTGFTTLDVRQPLNPSPYAMFAATASNAVVAATATSATTAGTATSAVTATSASTASLATTAITASNVVPGSVTGAGVASNSLLAVNLAAGQVVKSLNGQSDVVALTGEGGLSVTPVGGTVKLNPNAWNLAGNSGTSPTNGSFLGTTDSQPLELRVNNSRALRLEPGTSAGPNVVGGISSNSVDAGVSGATIAGGGATGGGNRVAANLGTIGGGDFNTIASGATHSTIAGGYQNTNLESYAAIPGGRNNLAAQQSFAAGTFAYATNRGAFVWADQQLAPFASTGPDQFLVRAAGGVGINTNNPGSNALNVNGNVNAASFTGNGSGLTALNPANLATGTAPISITGSAASASNFSGALAGDVTGSQGTTVVTSVGGQTSANVATGVSRALAGTSLNTASTLVARDASGNFSAGTVTAVNFVGNGSGLTGISGGTTASNAWVLGGNNVSAGQFLGSTNNLAVDLRANNVRALRLEPNTNGFPNVIAGAPANFVAANITGAAIAGGAGNTNSGDLSFIAGGSSNATAAALSFAAGQRAKANHRGTFVWADSQAADFASSGTNQFLIRAQGGTGINTTNLGTATFSVLGNQSGGWSNAVSVFQNTNTGLNISPALRVVAYGSNTDGAISISANGAGLIARFGNAAAWVGDITTNGTFNGLVFNPTSDRNAKQNFQPVDPRVVLEKITALPIAEWNYKLAPGEQHMGPTAQDFRAAFGLGTDDRHIATVDADGVALAAIQGLNQKLAEELKRRDAENAELRTRLERLERLLGGKAAEGAK